MRIKWQCNERASILFLRRNHKYSINQLSEFFGRSRSIIHQIVKFNQLIGNLAFTNLRKLPNQTRLLTSQKFRFSMERWIQLWTPFILGEDTEPP